MPFSKVEPFIAKISSKKIKSEYETWKVLLVVIIGCLSAALIVGIIFIILFSAGIFRFNSEYLIFD